MITETSLAVAPIASMDTSVFDLIWSLKQFFAVARRPQVKYKCIRSYMITMNEVKA